MIEPARPIDFAAETIDSAATSGQPDDDVDRPHAWIPVTPEEELCQADCLLLGVEGSKPLSVKKCVAKYRHELGAKLGDQFRDKQGNKKMPKIVFVCATTVL